MKKRILSFLLMSAMALSTVACGNSEGQTNSKVQYEEEIDYAAMYKESSVNELLSSNWQVEAPTDPIAYMSICEAKDKENRAQELIADCYFTEENPLSSVESIDKENCQMWYERKTDCYYVYEFYQSTLTSYSANGKIVNVFKLGDDALLTFFCQTEDGTLLFQWQNSYEESSKIIYFVGNETKVLYEGERIDSHVANVDNHGKILYQNYSNELITWDTVTGKRTKDYIGDNATFEGLVGMERDEDGNIFLFFDERVRELTPSAMVKDVTIKIQAFGYYPIVLEEAMDKYQASHFGVRFDRGFSFTESQRDVKMGQIYSDITGNDGPDIVCLNREYMEKFAREGAILDISDMIPEDFKSQMYDGIKTAGVMDGKYYMIPFDVRARYTLVKSDIYNKDYWTISDIISLIEKREKEGKPFKTLLVNTIGDCYDSMDLFTMDLASSKFIDMENRKCHFDDRDWVKILEICKRYDVTDTQLINRGSLGEDFRNGEILAMTNWSGSFGEFSDTYSMYGPEYKYVGYATEGGNGNFFVTQSGIAVNAKSQNLDVVEDFLRYLCNFDYTDSVHVMVRKDQYDYKIEKIKDMDGSYRDTLKNSPSSWTILPVDENGNCFKDQYINLLTNLKTYDTSIEGIRAIIYEEAAPVIAGKKSAQEAASIIQRRAQLYLDERG